jgi:hypothetical protein
MDGRHEAARPRPADSLAAWKECNDCAFIPARRGCSAPAHTEFGNMNWPMPQVQLRGRCGVTRARCRSARGHSCQLSGTHSQKETTMKNERKETDKKKGTLRPWLVDVSVEHLR